MPYTAIINQPGYLPEQEPETFQLEEDAREYLRSELERAFIDACEVQANVEVLEREYNEASENLSRYNYCHFLGYYYRYRQHRPMINILKGVKNDAKFNNSAIAFIYQGRICKNRE